jgi:hypothetical protein
MNGSHFHRKFVVRRGCVEFEKPSTTNRFHPALRCGACLDPEEMYSDETGRKDMQKKMKKCTVAFLISALVFFHFATISPAREHLEDLDEKGGYMAGDLLVVRPLGIAATAVGAVIYVISLPFSLAGGNEEEARQKLVIDPATYTFTRPLGEP